MLKEKVMELTKEIKYCQHASCDAGKIIKIVVISGKGPVCQNSSVGTHELAQT
jgi:hypothetical protein